MHTTPASAVPLHAPSQKVAALLYLSCMADKKYLNTFEEVGDTCNRRVDE